MHYCDVTLVMHDGRYRQRKNNVTVPEILVLRALHGGDDAVIDIEIMDVKRHMSSRLEKQRLMETYGLKPKSAEIIEKLFPGASPAMPTSVHDIMSDVPALNPRDPKGLLKGDEALEMPVTVEMPLPENTSVGDLEGVEAAPDDADDLDAIEAALPKGEDGEPDFSFLNEGTEAEQPKGKRKKVA